MIMMREGNASDDEMMMMKTSLILALSKETLRPLSGSPQPRDMWYSVRSAVQLDMSSY